MIGEEGIQNPITFKYFFLKYFRFVSADITINPDKTFQMRFTQVWDDQWDFTIKVNGKWNYDSANKKITFSKEDEKCENRGYGSENYLDDFKKNSKFPDEFSSENFSWDSKEIQAIYFTETDYWKLRCPKLKPFERK